MKKTLALILAFVMVMAMDTTAFAAEGSGTVTNNGSEQQIDVSAKHESGTTTPDSYSVVVEWGAMEFTYSVGGTRVWDDTKHEYVENTEAGWSANGNTVTVTNHSNVGIKADLSYVSDNAYGTVTGSFDKASITLESAVGTAYASAPKDTAALTLGGTLAESVTAMTKVGTIIVKISKAV